MGGQWTRIDPVYVGNKSALYLVIISSELEQYVEAMEIDKDRRFTAFKRIRMGHSLIQITTALK